MADIRVKKGDTLWNIAKRLGTDVQTLAKANGIKDPNRLKIGQVLRAPGAGSPAPIPATMSPSVAASRRPVTRTATPNINGNGNQPLPSSAYVDARRSLFSNQPIAETGLAGDTMNRGGSFARLTLPTFFSGMLTRPNPVPPAPTYQQGMMGRGSAPQPARDIAGSQLAPTMDNSQANSFWRGQVSDGAQAMARNSLFAPTQRFPGVNPDVANRSTPMAPMTVANMDPRLISSYPRPSSIPVYSPAPVPPAPTRPPIYSPAPVPKAQTPLTGCGGMTGTAPRYSPTMPTGGPGTFSPGSMPAAPRPYSRSSSSGSSSSSPVARPSYAAPRSSSSSGPASSAQTFRGSSSGTTYTVGKTYSNASGSYVAQSNGTFKKV